MVKTLMTEDELGSAWSQRPLEFIDSIEETLGKHASIKFAKEPGCVQQFTGLCERRGVILWQCASSQK